MLSVTPRGAVRIVTDTTASLPPGYAEAHGLEVVAQVVIFGEESFLEERELSADGFLRRLHESPIPPKTAAPPPGEFVAAYRRQLALGDTLLSLHPSSEVSGTVRSARTAIASDFEGADIRVLDTRTISGNLGNMVQQAVAWAEEGLDADVIMARLCAMIPRSRIFFLIRTLEFLQRGGRIGKAAGAGREPATDQADPRVPRWRGATAGEGAHIPARLGAPDCAGVRPVPAYARGLPLGALH